MTRGLQKKALQSTKLSNGKYLRSELQKARYKEKRLAGKVEKLKAKYNKKINGKEFPDKSITHRAYILASQCLGVSKINGLNSQDVKVTINTLKKLGIKIVSKRNWDYVYGTGISGFKKFKRGV